MVTFSHCSVPLEGGALNILGFSNFSLDSQPVLTPNREKKEKREMQRRAGKGRGSRKRKERDKERGRKRTGEYKNLYIVWSWLS